jgi:hypothetical protein
MLQTGSNAEARSDVAVSQPTSFQTAVPAAMGTARMNGAGTAVRSPTRTFSARIPVQATERMTALVGMQRRCAAAKHAVRQLINTIDPNCDRRGLLRQERYLRFAATAYGAGHAIRGHHWLKRALSAAFVR